MLTALIQHKGGSLVIDLPRDRMDLEVKIRSIGIDRSLIRPNPYYRR